MRRLAKAIEGLEEPAVEKIARDQQDDPFQVLIATLLSAQTKDAVTAAASSRLFRVARTPRTMATRRFEQHTPTDSAVTTLANGCVSGWVHLQKSERREIKCLPYGDRFAGSPVDDAIIGLLPSL